MNQELELVDAVEIAAEYGVSFPDLQRDVDQANRYASHARSAESLFRCYMEQYAQERNSDFAMLTRTGYGDRFEA